MQNPNGNQSTTPKKDSKDKKKCFEVTPNNIVIGKTLLFYLFLLSIITLAISLYFEKGILYSIIAIIGGALIYSLFKLFPFLGIKELFSNSESQNQAEDNEPTDDNTQRINVKEKTSEKVLFFAKALISWGVIVSLVSMISFLFHYGSYAEKAEEPLNPLSLKFNNTIDSLSQSSTILSFDTTQLKTLQEIMKDNSDKNAIDYASSFGDFMAGTALGLWSLGGLLLVYVSFLGQQIGLLHTQKELDATNKSVEDTKKTVIKQTKALQGVMRALKTQNDMTNIKKFEDRFFRFIDFYNAIEFPERTTEEIKLTPKEFFLRNQFTLISTCFYGDNIFFKSFVENFEKYKQIYESYLFIFFNLLHIIHTSNLIEEQRQKYIRYIRDIVSPEEILIVLFVIIFLKTSSHYAKKILELNAKYNIFIAKDVEPFLQVIDGPNEKIYTGYALLNKSKAGLKQELRKTWGFVFLDEQEKSV